MFYAFYKIEVRLPVRVTIASVSSVIRNNNQTLIPVRLVILIWPLIRLLVNNCSKIDFCRGWLQVCCSDDVNLFCPSSFIKTSYAPGREWVAAPVVGHSGHTVVLSWAACAANQHMVGLRYAWRETPCRYNQCAIYDATSRLPMPPYIHLGLLDTGITMVLPRTQLNILWGVPWCTATANVRLLQHVSHAF